VIDMTACEELMPFLRDTAPNAMSIKVALDTAPQETDTKSQVLRVRKFLIQYANPQPNVEPLEECLALIRRAKSDQEKILAQLSPAWRDYAIASVYSLLMPRKQRKNFGVYFTPPHLVNHLVSRLVHFGLDLRSDALCDPAAGGAAFLVPLARIKTQLLKKAGLAENQILNELKAQLVGWEIDVDLAKLSNALLRRMLVEEFNFRSQSLSSFNLTTNANSLELPPSRFSGVQHEIGNPPYLRLNSELQQYYLQNYSDIARGRLNLYTIFIRKALDRMKPGALLAYVIPASFIGGPEFANFRARLLELADVLSLDSLDARQDVFADVIQDACFLVLRRKNEVKAKSIKTSEVSSGILNDSTFIIGSPANVSSGGAAWKLPGKDISGGQTLRELGYIGKVGYLVANRQGHLLSARSGKGRLPLIWAKAITPDGKFNFERGAAHKGLGWTAVCRDAPYVHRRPCVIVQRTSARNQKRRVVAAAVPSSFVKKYGGFVCENHLIALVPITPSAVSPTKLAKLLNTREASDAMNRVCGAPSISVRLLEAIELPIDLPLQNTSSKKVGARYCTQKK
jgi:adenine-specific DNA-methyltransferase